MAKRRSNDRTPVGSRPIGSKATVQDIITERIMAELEAGTIPWRKPWNAPWYAPRNLVSGKQYRGINAMLLGSLPGGSPFWLTFKQAQGMGAHIRKGEHGCPVVFWKTYDKDTTNDQGEPTTERRWVLRYYTVFNVTQCDGLPEIPEIKIPEFDPIDRAQSVVNDYVNHGGPSLAHGSGRACYSPHFDRVAMPYAGHFDAREAYYSTLFHELGHSTGHPSRLARLEHDAEPAPFGSEDYSKEELVAEMTAAFLCGECAIEQTTIENSAAYIASWLRALDNDRRMVITAGAQAQKAADLILGRSADDSESCWDVEG